MTVQQVTTSVAGRALSQASARIAAGDWELSALIRNRQDKSERLDKLRSNVAALANVAGIDAEERLRTAETEMAVLSAEIDALDSRLIAEFPSFLQLTAPRPLRVSDVQALLSPDEALLFTFGEETATYTWAISKTDFDWNRADIGRETLASRVKQLRVDLSGSGDLRAGKSLKTKRLSQDARPFSQALAYRIYADVFEPLEPVFRDADHLMMVFNGPLTSLPPAVLITQDPGGSGTATAEGLRAVEWLIKRHALTTLPSVSSLKSLRQSKRTETTATRAASFVGFGDPVLGYRLEMASTAAADGDGTEAAVTTRGAYDAVVEVAQLAPLPNTSKELRNLAKIFGRDNSQVYLAADATENTVKSTDMSTASIVAFATHGLLAEGLPGLSEPALVFTPPSTPSADDDALLMASEAAALNLSADLVILSACDTAGSDGTPGAEGLSGLARAFIYAGARSILVSHWPVDDYAASTLTTEMLRGMYNQETPRHRAQALQHSMLTLMSDRSNDRFAHPSIWAPFVIVGEGGE